MRARALIASVLVSHGALGPYSFNFSCPKDPTAVLISTVYAGSNAVEIRSVFGREINLGLSQAFFSPQF